MIVPPEKKKKYNTVDHKLRLLQHSSPLSQWVWTWPQKSEVPAKLTLFPLTQLSFYFKFPPISVNRKLCLSHSGRFPSTPSLNQQFINGNDTGCSELSRKFFWGVGCHKDWEVTLAFGGQNLEMTNVLQSMRQSHTMKDCLGSQLLNTH